MPAEFVLKCWAEFVRAVEAAGLELEHLKVDDVLKPTDELELQVLATGSPTGGVFPDTTNGPDINNDSLVMMLKFGGRRVLLTGDIEKAAQRALVQTYCEGPHIPNGC